MCDPIQCLSAPVSAQIGSARKGMEEYNNCHDTIVDPLTGRSSTGDSSGITAGGLVACRGVGVSGDFFLERGKFSLRKSSFTEAKF